MRKHTRPMWSRSSASKLAAKSHQPKLVVKSQMRKPASPFAGGVLFLLCNFTDFHGCGSRSNSDAADRGVLPTRGLLFELISTIWRRMRNLIGRSWRSNPRILPVLRGVLLQTGLHGRSPRLVLGLMVQMMMVGRTLRATFSTR